eukprot:scpid31711/ scgid0150/ 
MQIQMWLYTGIVLYLSYTCMRTYATQPALIWKTCAQTNARTWQVDWAFCETREKWEDAKGRCQDAGGNLATAQTITQRRCASSTVTRTSTQSCSSSTAMTGCGVWVGLKGTWPRRGGTWTAWNWEVTQFPSGSAPPWTSQNPVIDKDMKYGYYWPERNGLENTDKNSMLMYLCQRYVPKENWYSCNCTADQATGCMQTLYISTPKNFDGAAAECATRSSILANIQNMDHKECAISLLGPRNGQCNSTSCRGSCKANTCNVWVALKKMNSKWKWLSPVQIVARNITWINNEPNTKGGFRCVYYSPEHGRFENERCQLKKSFYCQRYIPSAPFKITVNSTENQISARILHSNVLPEWITGFCLNYSMQVADKGNTAARVICNTDEFILLGNLTANTMYRIVAFSNSTTGLYSSISPEVCIGTLPRAPTMLLNGTITSTTIAVCLYPIQGGNLPVQKYCVTLRAAFDPYGNLSLISICNDSIAVTITGLAPNTTYNVSTYVVNKFGDSATSNFILFTTLPPDPRQPTLTTELFNATSICATASEAQYKTLNISSYCFKLREKSLPPKPQAASSMVQCTANNSICFHNLALGKEYVFKAHVITAFNQTSPTSKESHVKTQGEVSTTIMITKTNGSVLSTDGPRTVGGKGEVRNNVQGAGEIAAGVVCAILAAVVVAGLIIRRKRTSASFSLKWFPGLVIFSTTGTPRVGPDDANPIERNQGADDGLVGGGQPERHQNRYEERSLVPIADRGSGLYYDALGPDDDVHYENTAASTLVRACHNDEHHDVLTCRDDNTYDNTDFLANSQAVAAPEGPPSRAQACAILIASMDEDTYDNKPALDSHTVAPTFREKFQFSIHPFTQPAMNENFYDNATLTLPHNSTSLRPAVSGGQLSSKFSSNSRVNKLEPCTQPAVDEDFYDNTALTLPVDTTSLRPAVSAGHMSAISASNSRVMMRVDEGAYDNTELVRSLQVLQPRVKQSQSTIDPDNVYNTLRECYSPTEDGNMGLNYDSLDRSKIKASSELRMSQVDMAQRDHKGTSDVTICNPIHVAVADTFTTNCGASDAEDIYDNTVLDGVVRDSKQG